MKVTQLVVMPQGRDLNGCGFHALFNASTVLTRLAPSSEGLAGVATTTHCGLHDELAFQSERAAWVAALKAKAQQEGDRFYPWTIRCVDAGVLERLHAEYLIEHYPSLAALGGKEAFVLLPELCTESLKTGLFGEAEATAVHGHIQAFRQASVQAVAFLIGSLNHWVTLVAHKRGTDVELWYMDSRGYDIAVCAGDEERLHHMVQTYVEATASESPLGVEERRRSHLQSLRSTHFAIHLLADCLAGRTRFPDVAFGYAVEGIAECWLAFRKEKTPTSPPLSPSWTENDARERRKALVLEWLRDYNGLQALERDVVRKIEMRGGIEKLSPQARLTLRTWLDDMVGHHLSEVQPRDVEPVEAESTTGAAVGERTLASLVTLLRPLRQQLMQTS